MCLPSTFWRTERRTVVIPMTSQFGCLELLITRTFLSGLMKFEIMRVDCIIWFQQTAVLNNQKKKNNKKKKKKLVSSLEPAILYHICNRYGPWNYEKIKHYFLHTVYTYKSLFIIWFESNRMEKKVRQAKDFVFSWTCHNKLTLE